MKMTMKKKNQSTNLSKFEIELFKRIFPIGLTFGSQIDYGNFDFNPSAENNIYQKYLSNNSQSLAFIKYLFHYIPQTNRYLKSTEGEQSTTLTGYFYDFNPIEYRRNLGLLQPFPLTLNYLPLMKKLAIGVDSSIPTTQKIDKPYEIDNNINSSSREYESERTKNQLINIRPLDLTSSLAFTSNKNPPNHPNDPKISLEDMNISESKREIINNYESVKPFLNWQIKKSENDKTVDSSDFGFKQDISPELDSQLLSNTNYQSNRQVNFDYSKIDIISNDFANDITNKNNADAFTIGSTIFFPRKNLGINSPKGLGLIAHEITHVKQLKKLGKSLNQSEKIDNNKNAFEQEALEKEQSVIDYASDILRKDEQSHFTAEEGLNILKSFTGVATLNIPANKPDIRSTVSKFLIDFKNVPDDAGNDSIGQKSDSRMLDFQSPIRAVNESRYNSTLHTNNLIYPRQILHQDNIISDQNYYLSLYSHPPMPPKSSRQTDLNRIGTSLTIYHQSNVTPSSNSVTPTFPSSSPSSSMIHQINTPTTPLFAKQDRNIQSDNSAASKNDNHISASVLNSENLSTYTPSRSMPIDIDIIVERVFQLLQNKIKIQRARRGM